MTWIPVAALLMWGGLSRPSTREVSPPLTLTVFPSLGELSCWYPFGVFKAVVRNSGTEPLWLDLGTPNAQLELRSHFVLYSSRRALSSNGASIGVTDDWGSIETLRSPNATLLRPGEVATRTLLVEDVVRRAGHLEVNLTVRIHGTDNLDDPTVRTYEPEATVHFRVFRRGRCLEVRRLTGR